MSNCAYPTERGLSGSHGLSGWSRRLLTWSVFLYTASVFLITPIPGLSRIPHLFLAGCVGSLILRSLRVRIIIPREPLIMLAASLGGYALISVLWSMDVDVALSRAISLAVSMLATVVIWTGLHNGITLRPILYGSLVGAVINASLALLQLQSGDTLRASGLTGNPNSLALQLSMAGLIVLAAASDGKRWPMVFTVAMVWVATIVSGSRKVIFLWPMLLILGGRRLFVWMRRSYAVIAAILFIMPLALMIVVSKRGRILHAMEDLYVVHRMIRFFEGRDTSGAERIDMIREGLQLWVESPIWGHGIDQFRVLTVFDTYSHNNYIELLANLGLVGLLLYYSIYVTIGIRALRSHQYRTLVVVAMMTLFLWDVAVVSYASRLQWLFLAVMGYLASVRENNHLRWWKPTITPVIVARTVHSNDPWGKTAPAGH